MNRPGSDRHSRSSAVKCAQAFLLRIRAARYSAGEDAAYFSQAETLCDRILQKQTTDLGAVTGATLSSIGLLDAVDAALEQAVK